MQSCTRREAKGLWPRLKKWFRCPLCSDCRSRRRTSARVRARRAKVGFGVLYGKVYEYTGTGRFKGCGILDHTSPPRRRRKDGNSSRPAHLRPFHLERECHYVEGFLFNVDGMAIASRAHFGPKKIVYRRINKVVANLDEAYERLKAYAAPINNISSRN